MAKTLTEEFDLWEGKYKGVFYPTSHRYKVDGEWKKSVSTIVGIVNKPMLIPWAVDQTCGFMLEKLEREQREGYHPEEIRMMVEEARIENKKKKEQAADLGNAIHCAIQRLPMPEGIVLTDEQKALIDKAVGEFDTWLKETDRTVLAVERFLYHPTLNYIGKCDMIVDHKGEGVEVIDIKATGGIYPEQKAQLAGYMKAWNAEFEALPALQATRGLIMHVDKQEGNVVIHPVALEDLENAGTMFEACLDLTNAIAKM